MSQQQQQQLTKLPFKVAYCSSYDDDYMYTELESHNPRTRGWQSKRLDPFPQVLVLDFGRDVDIKKLQILSHHSKIASSVDLYIGRVPAGTLASVQQAEMSRLGYLTLDNNERTTFTARELKSVYVSATGRYLKMVIQGCHPNSINTFNQVGIVAINVLGDIPLLGGGGAAGFNGFPSALGGMLPSAMMGAGGAGPVSGSNIVPGLNLPADDKTNILLLELIRRKDEAVRREDYDEAKRMKVAVDRLKAIATKISALEAEKQQYVENEEFDSAKRIKQEIDALRREAIAGADGSAAPPPSHGAYDPYASLAGGGGGGGGGASARGSYQDSYDAYPPSSSSSSSSAYGDERPIGGAGGARASAMTAYPPSSFSSSGPEEYGSGSSAFSSPGQGVRSVPASSASKAAANEDRPIKGSGIAATRSNSIGSSSASGAVNTSLADERPIKPIGGGGGQMMSEYPEGMDGSEDAASALPVSGRPRGRNSATSLSGAAAAGSGDGESSFTTPRAFGSAVGAPSSSADGEPDELSAAELKDAEPLIEVLGMPLVKMVYAKQWVHRQHALKDLNEMLENSNLPAGVEPSTLLRTFCAVLRRTLDDTPVVSLGAIQVLESTIASFSAQGMAAAVLSAAVEPLVPLVLKQLSSSNTRCRTAAHETLVSMTRHRSLDPSVVTFHLLKALPKNEADKPLILKGRAALLLDVLPRLGFVEGTQRAGLVQLAQVIKFVLPALPHRDGSVREMMVKIIALAFELTGAKAVRPYLKDVPQNLLDVINTAVGGTAGGAGAGAAGAGGAKESKSEEAPLPAARAAPGAKPGVRASAAQAEKEKQGGSVPGSSPPKQRVGAGGAGPASSSVGAGSKAGAGAAGGAKAAPGKERPGASKDKEPVGKAAPSTPAAPPKAGPPAKTAAPAPAPAPVPVPVPVAGGDVDGMEGDLPQGFCQFCGFHDPSYTEEMLDMHYCQDCPMLTQCKLCEQVIEIPTLGEHLTAECELKDTTEGAAASKTLQSNIAASANRNPAAAQVCPLCFAGIGAGEQGWRQHLLEKPYCQANPRKRN